MDINIEKVKESISEGVWALVVVDSSYEEAHVTICEGYENAIEKMDNYVAEYGDGNEFEKESIHSYHCVTGDGHLSIQQLKIPESVINSWFK